jgi:transposase-like protein
MSKRKHSPEWMLARVREYLTGEGSYKAIAAANGIGETTLLNWVQKFQEQGEAAFAARLTHEQIAGRQPRKHRHRNSDAVFWQG